MEKRFAIDPEVFLERHPREEHDQSLIVELSDYDIPREVAASELPDGILQLRFLYPDQEESVIKKIDDVLSILMGKHSGKIIGLKVRVQQYKIGKIGLVIEKIGEQIASLSKVNQRLNYKLIQDVLEEKKELLESRT